MYKYLFDINYNNKVFSIFLGENNHKAFLESKNGKYYYPLYEDYLYLNNKFNKENFVSFKIEKFNLKEKVMIKSTAVALALITVTTASMVKSKPKYNTKDIDESKSMIEELLANQPQIYVSENKINSKSDLDKFLGYETVSDEELYNAIDNNNQISKENKEKIYTVINKIKEKYPDWNVYCSKNANPPENLNVFTQSDLHLSVSLRSFKSALLSDFVQNVMDCKPNEARIVSQDLCEHYPILITRNLARAKNWVRSKARGSERMGLLAHSNAIRLKPEGIFVKSEIDCTNWFLNKKTDVRSSCALEDCATEFDVQGLELDWTIVAWDANLRFDKGWKYLKFSGNRWQNINNDVDKKYLLNSYRVLLTRARQGMVIFIPEGDKNDETRLPEFYDNLFKYLGECGLQVLPD